MNTIIRPVVAEGSLPDPVAQLQTARRLVEDRYSSEQPLARAALHLIDCATDIVGQLPDGDLDAARGALGSARAAVVSATFAVGRVRDMSSAGADQV